MTCLSRNHPSCFMLLGWNFVLIPYPLMRSMYLDLAESIAVLWSCMRCPRLIGWLVWMIKVYISGTPWAWSQSKCLRVQCISDHSRRRLYISGVFNLRPSLTGRKKLEIFLRGRSVHLVFCPVAILSRMGRWSRLDVSVVNWVCRWT
jgi:hypothetical protein